MPKLHRPHPRFRDVLVPHVIAALLVGSVMVGTTSTQLADSDWCDLFPQWPGCPVSPGQARTKPRWRCRRTPVIGREMIDVWFLAGATAFVLVLVGVKAARSLRRGRHRRCADGRISR